MIFKKIVTICLISMFAATVIASRSRRQAVNCTPQEMKELKSVGINLEKSKIDCSAAISAPVADKHKSSQQKGEKQNDGGRRYKCLLTFQRQQMDYIRKEGNCAT
ncbi:hypothetical protein AC249_AIPGENE7561 [Exaiptasia diaphana]|nr:hypothetical protein AC249_AIPGENE7561 [Exaiptasia diaphana]